MPDPHGFGEGQIELRQVYEGSELTDNPELIADHSEMMAQLQKRTKS